MKFPKTQVQWFAEAEKFSGLILSLIFGIVGAYEAIVIEDNYS